MSALLFCHNTVCQPTVSTLELYFTADLIFVFCPEESLATLEASGLRFLYCGDTLQINQAGLEYATLVNTPMDSIILEEGQLKNFPLPLLNALVSKCIPQFYAISKDSRISIYTAPRTAPSDSLLIYPGHLLPVSNGSQQRALSLVIDSWLNDKPLDLLLVHEEDLHETIAFFASYGIKVTVLFKRHPGTAHRLLSCIRAFLKRLLHLDYYLPVTIRRGQFIRSVSKKAFKQAIFPYHRIIYSYVWSIVYQRTNHEQQLCCDTHDVNYVRDEHYATTSTFGKYLHLCNRWFELSLLRSMHTIFTISASDAELLASSLGTHPSIKLLTPSFSWLDYPALPPTGITPRFGFIGTDMIANRRSIRVIMDEQWLALYKINALFCLYVAGKICEFIREMYPDGKPGVHLMDSVSSLSHFYSNVDVLVCPVIQQGGLNFKIAEALCCGKVVLTNERGMRPFPKTSLLIELQDISTESDARQLVDRIVLILSDSRKRQDAAKVYRSYFRSHAMLPTLDGSP
jgi:hypothetical protein